MAIATPFPASYASTVRRERSASQPRSASSVAAPVRLTRRGKAVVALGASLACLALLQLTGGVQAVASGVSSGPATASVVVQPGETLWEIAKRVSPNEDPRAAVATLRELNGLQAQTALLAGQSLSVPR